MEELFCFVLYFASRFFVFVLAMAIFNRFLLVAGHANRFEMRMDIGRAVVDGRETQMLLKDISLCFL